MQENEPRFIVETGMEARIAALVEPVLEDALYRLIRVRITGQNGCTLQIMAERHDGTMTIEDCENIHNLLSALLDVENVIEHAQLRAWRHMKDHSIERVIGDVYE